MADFRSDSRTATQLLPSLAFLNDGRCPPVACSIVPRRHPPRSVSVSFTTTTTSTPYDPPRFLSCFPSCPTARYRDPADPCRPSLRLILQPAASGMTRPQRTTLTVALLLHERPSHPLSTTITSFSFSSTTTDRPRPVRRGPKVTLGVPTTHDVSPAARPPRMRIAGRAGQVGRSREEGS